MKSMDNERSIAKIEGHIFYLEEKGLRNSEAPYNLLPYNQMDGVKLQISGQNVGRFMYDSINRCFADTSSYKQHLPETLKYMEIPNMFTMVRDKSVEDIVLNIAESKPKGMYSEDGFLKLRTMPITKIFGTSFIVDVLNLCLMEALNTGNKISFDNLNVLEENGKIFFEYNVATKNIALPTDNPDSVAIVFLPPLKELDPFAWAIMTDEEEIENTKEVTVDRIHKDKPPKTNKSAKRNGIR
ncbi:hypothetical protein FXV77_05175 [Sphingobacterium phlebotomi]|uniref:Uncharacterized protein n=1 Tax=Sphingobacterium phlebotomi TaxID=2605433 RepID=A0A5D4HC52_9SPHI|nr:hypothetical protein [Sphingobacterium phlebotomi]TYR37399.1 hypothetical protein FXV77_05175 [Sphingobacterium phlebotomi]